MRTDIQSREDLLLIVSSFYVDLLQSKELSHFFEAFKDEEVLKNHLETLLIFGTIHCSIQVLIKKTP